ncbi:hypothetical protein GQ55_4G065900 [Panicum hallii var. hallii]|uniref:Uncharacterized protein n=3 Tax=Panicum sect. Panicum TaxID=2100772 RepID=A0A3L6PBL9_PANMI|nr:uncharacterized protein LOC112888789 [Panicum hallii]PAN23045.1 hypothetical protein PAHAL_4G064200 [Panicum hallii]PUZ59724.1 hypothetical protein GQ55_4G065900 [Panicum hallii var. hallii]RLM54927.1 hypothetical protein C2845_PM10G17640 [Panicum miliaceum]
MEDAGGGRRQQETAAGASKAQREAAAAGVSVHEWLQHVKASFLGLVRKVTARSEQEAAEADMMAAKAQVEATDEAEAKKKRLG